MPTVLRVGAFRFSFYSNEGTEPSHIHVFRGEDEAKFWLDPQVELADSHGFARNELTEVRKIIEENRTLILEAWNDHFNAK